MEISYSYETDFHLDNEKEYSHWIDRVVASEGFLCSELSYVFCDDEYLLALNKRYLNHDTLTDIITFDYTDGKMISGDIFISIERVLENAKVLHTDEVEELKRVMAHGVLHLIGYTDRSDEDKERMRNKEDEKINMFHVEQ